MTTLKILACAALLALGPMGFVFAEQAVCPVSGKPGNPAITAEYQGKKYSFCCKGCASKFEKNPEKYLAEAKA